MNKKRERTKNHYKSKPMVYVPRVKICPNCNVELTEKSHCNLCGWEETNFEETNFKCTYDDTLRCPILNEFGTGYDFCKFKSCSHYKEAKENENK